MRKVLALKRLYGDVCGVTDRERNKCMLPYCVHCTVQLLLRSHSIKDMFTIESLNSWSDARHATAKCKGESRRMLIHVFSCIADSVASTKYDRTKEIAIQCHDQDYGFDFDRIEVNRFDGRRDFC